MTFLLLLALGYPDQPAKIYKAQEILLESPELVVLEYSQICKFVERVYSSSFIRTNFPKIKRPLIKRSEFPNVAYCSGNTLAFPPKACNHHVLHEIAHHLSQGHEHDELFARRFLRLVAVFMGERSAKMLRQSYTRNGVIF